MTDMVTTVVRGFGYEMTHVVTVPASAVQTWQHPWSLGVPFDGILTPVMARCGRRISSRQDCVVVMATGTVVRCRECHRTAGIGVQS